MKMKNIMIIAVAAVLIASCAFGIHLLIQNEDISVAEGNIEIDKLPIFPMKGSFVYDVNNINEAVGISDYVFVGEVISNDGTVYKNIVTMEDENGNPKEVGTPYTNYVIKVKDNIKGNLKKDLPIDILKHGGISQDNKSVIVFENDLLPKVNETYIFLGYAQKDGSILISGPNSNVPLTSSDQQSNTLSKQNFSATDVYQQYQKAYQNEVIKVQRKRFHSTFEE